MQRVAIAVLMVLTLGAAVDGAQAYTYYNRGNASHVRVTSSYSAARQQNRYSSRSTGNYYYGHNFNRNTPR